MATPLRPQRSTPTEKGTQLLSELLSIHRTKVFVAIGAIILIGLGGLFYRRSVELKAERAETAYFRARQAFDARNYALAETDLRGAVARYKGTAGGTQAAMVLAQVLYETGKAQEGITMLRDVVQSAPRDLRPELHALIAGGHENLGQLAEAAREYEQAGAAARFPQDQMLYRAAAARAYMGAGSRDEALAIWRELADEPSEFMANEARVRVGELTAEPAG